jgi:thioredoxin-like negative regulator of GroEL
VFPDVLPVDFEPAPVSFSVSIGAETARLPYQKVFAIGYHLWRKQKYPDALLIFEKISRVTDRGPRAHILLAHCLAMQGDFAECSSVLSGALPRSHYGDAAADLHCAFVSWKCTAYQDARASLEKVAREHPELPSICLILADFLQAMGNRVKPVDWLKTAIARDRNQGAVGMIARKQLPVALRAASRQ